MAAEVLTAVEVIGNIETADMTREEVAKAVGDSRMGRLQGKTE